MLSQLMQSVGNNGQAGDALQSLLLALSKKQLARMSASDALPVVSAGKFVSKIQSVYAQRHPNASLSLTDRDTMELVARGFDQLMVGAWMDDVAKGLLSALLLPCLRVALLERRRYFASAAHPARRLPEKIAMSLIGWQTLEPIFEHKDYLALYNEMHGLLAAESLAEADFQRAIERLEEGIEGFDKAEGIVGVTAKDRQVVSGEQQCARAVATALDTKLKGIKLESVVETLLHRGWRQVLTAIWHQSGQASSEWRTALNVVDVLLTSTNESTCARLPSSDRERLLVNLPQSTDYLKVQLLRHGPFDVKHLSDMLAQLEALQLQCLKPTNDEWGGVGAATRQDSPRKSAERTANESAALDALVDNLREGDHAAYRVPASEPMRVKIAAIIQQATVFQQATAFILVNRDGKRVAQLSRNELKDALSEGRFKLLSDRDNFDQTVSSMVGAIRNERGQ